MNVKQKLLIQYSQLSLIYMAYHHKNHMFLAYFLAILLFFFSVDSIDIFYLCFFGVSMKKIVVNQEYSQ